MAMTAMGTTSAVAYATLAGSRADVWCYYGTNDPGQQRSGWMRGAQIGSDVMTGQVTSVLSNLLPDTTYHVNFYATNAATGREAWSEAKTFTTLQ